MWQEPWTPVRHHQQFWRSLVGHSTRTLDKLAQLQELSSYQIGCSTSYMMGTSSIRWESYAFLRQCRTGYCFCIEGTQVAFLGSRSCSEDRMKVVLDHRLVLQAFLLLLRSFSWTLVRLGQYSQVSRECMTTDMQPISILLGCTQQQLWSKYWSLC